MKISNRLIASLIKESLKRHLSEMSARFTPDRSDSSYYMTSPSLSKLNDNDFHPAAVHGAAELVAKTPRNPEGISAKGESAGLLQIADTSNALVSPDGSFYARIKANVYKSAFADRSANLDSSSPTDTTLNNPGAMYWSEQKPSGLAFFARVRSGKRGVVKFPVASEYRKTVPQKDYRRYDGLSDPYYEIDYDEEAGPRKGYSVTGQMGAAAQALVASWIVNYMGSKGVKNGAGQPLTDDDLSIKTTAGVGSSKIDIEL